jgi:hypothetical protein
MLLLPDGFFQARTSRIPYADIHGVIEAQVSGQTFLYVMARGRRFTVVASLFPDTASYVTVRNSLRSHVTDPLASVPAPR